MKTSNLIIVILVCVLIVLFIAIPFLLGFFLTIAIAPSQQASGNQCSASAGILITNHYVSSSNDNILLSLANQTPATLKDVQIQVNGKIDNIETTGTATIESLETTAQTKTINLLPSFNAGSKYYLYVQFSYQDLNGFHRINTSTCNGTAS